jgi:hypothetical protein
MHDSRSLRFPSTSAPTTPNSGDNRVKAFASVPCAPLTLLPKDVHQFGDQLSHGASGAE